MNKILIFGIPRSGTSVIQEELSYLTGVPSAREPFSVQTHLDKIAPAEGEDPYEWLAAQSNNIIKIISLNLNNHDFAKLINYGKFDTIIVTSRKNLTDMCVSLYYASYIGKKHYTQTPIITDTFLVPKSFVLSWISQYQLYVDALQYLDKNSIRYHLIDYDDYINGLSVNINDIKLTYGCNPWLDTVLTKIPYNKLCSNYDEVTKLITA